VTRALARSSTATPAPTNTLVIPPGTPLPPLISPVRTPTRTNAYRIVVPTPTAAALNRPVTYDTRFTAITYDVTGKTLNEISKSLHANAMPDAHEPNSRYFAQTEWFLTTDWAWKPTARGCEIDNAKVSVMVTMTLPSLITPDAVSDAQKRWNTFINNTIEHENGHVKIAYDGARNYQRDLSNFPPAPNCDDIQSRLNDLFRKHFNLIDRTNVGYDAKTRHGETQGAVFP
jgi:predicted secreted Zn-dependent protease